VFYKIYQIFLDFFLKVVYNIIHRVLLRVQEKENLVVSLSDSEKKKALPSVGRRAIGAKNKSWSDSQKLEAVTTFLMLGNVRLVSATLKIPEFTIRHWMKQQWWQDAVNELKVQNDLQLSNRLKKLVDRSLDALEDRLENGDWIYDQKTGELRRKPVNMRDAHKVAVDMIDKQELIRERQNSRPTGVEVGDRLEQLAKMFAEIATKKIDEIQRPVVNVTDVVYQEGENSDAIHDRGETGLQAGVREVPLETGPDQEPLEEDDCPEAGECSGDHQEG